MNLSDLGILGESYDEEPIPSTNITEPNELSKEDKIGISAARKESVLQSTIEEIERLDLNK